MALENLTGSNTIDALVATNPDGAADKVTYGFAHLRGIKNVLINTFPNLTGPVTLTETQFNAAIQLASGTVMAFGSTVAPTGWTQNTSLDHYMLRVVNTAGGGSGGTSDFFADMDATTTAGHVLTTAEIPAHQHSYTRYSTLNASGVVSGAGTNTVLNSTTSTSTGTTGSSAAHTHSLAFAPKYRDIILASKD